MGAFATLFLAYTLWDTEPVGAVEEPAPVDISRSELPPESPDEAGNDTSASILPEYILTK